MYYPAMAEKEAKRLYKGWQMAVAATRVFEPKD
jgi:hypothetical protein